MASTVRAHENPSTAAAAPAPTSTGAMEFGSVRGRAPSIHSATVAMGPSCPAGSAVAHARDARHIHRRHVHARVEPVPDVVAPERAADPQAPELALDAHLRLVGG